MASSQGWGEGIEDWAAEGTRGGIALGGEKLTPGAIATSCDSSGWREVVAGANLPLDAG